MARNYVQIPDSKRVKLLKLIHDYKYSIARAARELDIPYDNAKFINRVYLTENRIEKIDHINRLRRDSPAESKSD